MWRTPKSRPTLRMTDLPWAPCLRASCASEHAGVLAAFAAGGGSATSIHDRRTARELPSRRLAIDLEAAARVTAGVPGRGCSTPPATGSSNLSRNLTPPILACFHANAAEYGRRRDGLHAASLSHPARRQLAASPSGRGARIPSS